MNVPRGWLLLDQDGWEEAILTGLPTQRRVAVRSAFDAEDGEARSQAGRFRTVLNVDPTDREALCEAVLAVRASGAQIVTQTVLAVTLLALALVGVPVSHAEPETCPPQCDRIPASAWPDPRSLPLGPGNRWPALADVAVPVNAPRFGFEDLCASPPVPDARAFAVAARAVVGRPDGQLQLQGQIKLFVKELLPCLRLQVEHRIPG